MKKVFAAVLMLLGAAVFSSADENCKIGLREEKLRTDNGEELQTVKADDGKTDVPVTFNFWLIEGFQFADYKASDPKLETLVDNEIQAVQNYAAEHPENAEFVDNQVIVGHSQGGPCALAYATRYAEQGYDLSKIKGVVTVSGIDKGLKALDGGFGPLKSRLTNDVNIIVNGSLSVLGALPFSFCNTDLFFSMLGSSATMSGTLDCLTSLLPGDVGGYINAAWHSTDYSDVAQLYDMMPHSDFIDKNVCTTQSMTYKKQVDTTLVWEWKNIGWFYYLTCHEEPVYSTYTVSVDKAQFPDSVPVAYIVGGDSNTFDLGGETAEIAANVLIAGGGILFVTGALANVAEAAMAASCLNVCSAAIHTYYAIQCEIAALWCGNADGEIDELLGASDNDGLVAVESQYIPRYQTYAGTDVQVTVHDRMLGKENRNYYYYSEFNHQNILWQKNDYLDDKNTTDSMMNPVIINKIKYLVDLEKNDSL